MTIFEGVYDTVNRLYDAGASLAVVTSKTASTARRGLRLFSMERFFNEVIGMEDTTRHKPHPDPIILALERLNMNSSECLMVGDSPHDIESARAAGVTTVGVRWSQASIDELIRSNPDYMLESMNDLISICFGTGGRG